MGKLKTKASRRGTAQDRPTRTQPDGGGTPKAKPADTAPRRKRIGELLVADGFVEPEHVTEALEVQQRDGGKMVEILIKLGHLDAQSFARFITSQKGIPSIHLDHYDVPQELCKLIPRDYATKHEVIPIDRLGKLLTVGMAFPIDSDTIEELEVMTNLKVKALMCSHDDVYRAIDRYYPADPEAAEEPATEEQIESTVKLQHVAQLVREMDQLPTLPQTVQRVEKATKDPDSSLKEVAEIIALDPPVAAKLLRLANSAAYGFTNTIDSVDRATALLGLKETYMVVLSSAVLNLMEKSRDFDIEKFWEHSMLCALTSRGVAESKGEKGRGGVFTAGLLHDIGRFAFSEVAPKQYAKIAAGLTGAALVESEEKELGISHAEAGYILAAHWGLPPEICTAIRFHHAPQLAKEHQSTTQIVAIAATIAEAQSDGPMDEQAFADSCGVALMEWNFPPSGAYQIYTEALAAGRETVA